MCGHMHVDVREQPKEPVLLPVLCGPWGSNLGHRACIASSTFIYWAILLTLVGVLFRFWSLFFEMGLYYVAQTSV